MAQGLRVRHEFFNVGEVRLHAVTQGPTAGRSRGTIIMLHGFPEFWYCWKHQIPEFARDFRVVAPDLRGYNLSDKPAEPEAYKMPHLAGDILGLIDALGEEKIILMAHDWGGVVAWAFAATYPERLRHLIILNAPHPSLFMRDMVTQASQQESSQYIHLLRSEFGEDVMSRDDFRLMKKFIFGSMKNPERVSDEDVQLYVEAWSQPGALRGSMNFYRSMPVPPPEKEAAAKTEEQKQEELKRIPRVMINVPTLVIWGMQDHALLPSLLEGLDEFVPDLMVVRIEDGSHWVAHECADEVNHAVRNYLDERLK